MTSKLTPGASTRLNYVLIRNITTPEESENGAMTYSVVLKADEILKLSTEGNLRTYIPEHNLKKRSMVHRAIASTIRNDCDRFSQLNSGFLIGASSAKIDDAKKTIELHHASVNNGAQSQGEIRYYFASCEENEEEPNSFHVRAEISVEPDAATRTKIAIARNTATKIQDISSAGARGYFNELAESFQEAYPNLRLAKSETDYGDDVVDTRLVLQVLWAIMPDEIAPSSRRSVEARMRSYKNAASCLDDFMKLYDAKGADDETAERYRYFLDMAPTAWQLYTLWRTHPDWEKLRLREDAKQVKRTADGKVEKVADGVIFPILSALSKFVMFDEEDGMWLYKAPAVFQDKMMATAARRQLRAHDGKPMHMGRSSSAYEALQMMTEMALDLTDD
ncbi:AIPR family protein [uncultured Sphingomonas sp.]|uniref:AIPR family protein n=1 Tax=uncultured Sphingomonas sp. TaxID=158754 RepID=UPI0035CA3A68